jgi:hypothetical protein
MSNVKEIYVRALSLEPNELLVVRYKISEHNIGKIQLSSDIVFLEKNVIADLKHVLEIIEQYSIDYMVIPKQNSK